MTKGSSLRGGTWFLLVVLTLYGVAYLLDPEAAGQAFGHSVELALILVPVLGIVIVVLFLSGTLLRPDWVRRNLGALSGPRGWFLAAIGGILAAGPVYPWYAFLADLRSKGMRTGLASVFLYNRAIKLPLLPLLIHYFGLSFSLILLGYLILLSFPSGLLLERLVDNRLPPTAGGNAQRMASGRA